MKNIILLFLLFALFSCGNKTDLPTRKEYSAVCESKVFGKVKYAHITEYGTFIKRDDFTSYTYSPAVRCVVRVKRIVLK